MDDAGDGITVRGLEVIVVSIVAHATFTCGEKTLKRPMDFGIAFAGAFLLM